MGLVWKFYYSLHLLFGKSNFLYSFHTFLFPAHEFVIKVRKFGLFDCLSVGVHFQCIKIES